MGHPPDYFSFLSDYNFKDGVAALVTNPDVGAVESQALGIGAYGVRPDHNAGSGVQLGHLCASRVCNPDVGVIKSPLSAVCRQIPSDAQSFSQSLAGLRTYIGVKTSNGEAIPVEYAGP
jgi:hypothetical protein